MSYLYVHLFSNVLHRRRRISPRRPMYLLIVGSHYCVMRFAYALHMRQQKFVPFPCLYIEFFELVIEVIFLYCTTPPCHIIDLFKRPFRGCRSERLDNASVLLVSLIFLYPQKNLILLCPQKKKVWGPLDESRLRMVNWESLSKTLTQSLEDGHICCILLIHIVFCHMSKNLPLHYMF